jgi:hypothetical protein
MSQTFVFDGDDLVEWVPDGPTSPSIFLSISINGVKRWYMDGKLHRDGAPSTEYPDIIFGRPSGYRSWKCHGKYHRLDGPARTWNNGSKQWWIDGEKISYNEWRRMRKVWIEREAVERIKDLVI